MPHFVALNIAGIRQAFGHVPVLVCDDVSQHSPAIEEIARKSGAYYMRSEKRRGHFAADMQVFIAALAFARDLGLEIACKVSQRFICLSPEIRQQVETLMLSQGRDALFPGKPTRQTTRTFFGVFRYLTDIAFLRASKFDPVDIISRYRGDCASVSMANQYGSHVEFFWEKILAGDLKDKHEALGVVTNHIKDGKPFRYLRRYQNTEADYQDVARQFGLHTRFELGEWKEIEKRKYLCRPVVV